MAQKLTVEIIGDSKSVEKALNRTKQGASGLGGALNTASKGAAVGLAALAVGAKKLSDDASGLNESINAVNVVFGKAAGKVQAFAKIAAGEAGLSMRSFNELVTPVGAALQNVGFSADEAATASISLAKRAADMASVFNVDVSEALSAIQSGLRGEADPLEAFGVGLSDAAVTAEALSSGLAGTKKEITANDKAQARLALIMKQSDKVAGDFKKTSGELANKQRINAAEAENQRAKFGEGLLPVMQTLQGAIAKITSFLGEHSTATKIAAGAAAALAVGVLAVNGALKVYKAALVVARVAQLLFNAALLTNPLVLIAVAIAAVGVALVVAYKKSETFREIVNGAFGAVKTAVATAIRFILSGIDKYLGGIEMMVRAMSKLPFIGKKFEGLADSVAGARDKVRALKSSIDDLKSKDIKITTTLLTVYQERDERLPGNPIGRRAHGGPVTAGSPYMVGEKGPELFIPGMSGQILSAAKLASAARRTPRAASAPANTLRPRLSAIGGGSSKITLSPQIKIEGPTFGTDRRRIARELGEDILQYLQGADRIRSGGRGGIFSGAPSIS